MNPRSPKGVTLLEMLVAVIITGIVVTIAANMLRDQKSNFRQIREKVKLQADARQALRIMEAELRNLGYRQEITTNAADVYSLTATPTTCALTMADPTGTPVDNSSFVAWDAGASGATDSIAFAYPLVNTSTGTVTCANANTRWVQYAVDTSGALTRKTAQTRAGLAAASAVPIFRNISVLQIRYGIQAPFTQPWSSTVLSGTPTAWAASVATVSAAGAAPNTIQTITIASTGPWIAYLPVRANLTAGSTYRISATFTADANFLPSAATGTGGRTRLSIGFSRSAAFATPSPAAADVDTVSVLSAANSNAAGQVYSVNFDITPRTGGNAYLAIYGLMSTTTSAQLQVQSIDVRQVANANYTWVDAPSVTDKAQVKAIRVMALATTAQKINFRSQTFNFSANFTTYTANDKTARIQFERIIPVGSNGN